MPAPPLPTGASAARAGGSRHHAPPSAGLNSGAVGPASRQAPQWLGLSARPPLPPPMGRRAPGLPPLGRVSAGRRKGDGVDETGAPSPGRRGRAGRPYEEDDAFDPAINTPPPAASRPPPGRPGARSWAGPGSPPAPRAPAPPAPITSGLLASDDDDALADDDDALGDDEDVLLGGVEGDDDFDLDDDDDDEDEEEDEDEDDSDEGDLFSDTDDLPEAALEGGDDVGLDVDDVDDLLLDPEAAGAAAVLGSGSGAIPKAASSLLDAVAAGDLGSAGPITEGARRARWTGGAAAGGAASGAGGATSATSAIGLPDLEEEEGGEDGLFEDAEGPVAYPPPPDRAWGLGDLLSRSGVMVAAVAGAAPDGASLTSAAALDSIACGGVESDPAAVREGDLLAWRGPPARAGPATPPPYPDFYRGLPCNTAGEAVTKAAAAGAVAVLVVAEPGSPEDADPAGAAASLSSRGGGLPVIIVSAAAAAAVLDEVAEHAVAVADAVAEAATAAAGAGEAGGKLPDLPRSTLAGGGPAIAGPPAAAVGAALASTFYDAPGCTPAMPTVAFVGGPGKTTSAWLVRGILEEAGALVAMADSSEFALHADRLDDAGGLWVADEADPTAERACSAAFHLAPYQGKYPPPELNPDGVRLARVLAGGADRGAGAAVVSLSPGALAAGAGHALSPDVLVFTGTPTERVTGAPVAADSPEVASVLAAFASLADPDRQRAVVNADDPLRNAVIEAAAGVPVLTYGLYDRTCDVWCAKVRFTLWETEMLVKTPIGSIALSTPLLGRANIYNVLAAVAAGMASRVIGFAAEDKPTREGEGEEGEEEEDTGAIKLEEICRGIEATEVVPGRCESIDEGQPFAVVVDAADTAAALGTLLDGLREAGAKRVITVVGADGGSPAPGRPFLGEAAHYKSDIVIVSNVNPRGEAPDAVAADVCAGFPKKLLAANARAPYPPGFLQDPGRVDSTTLDFLMNACWQHQRYVCEDRWMAIRWAIGTAGPDDAVVLAGKGAQDFVEWADEHGNPVRGWFDDRVEARNALARAPSLWAVTDLDRSELPWVEWDERDVRV